MLPLCLSSCSSRGRIQSECFSSAMESEVSSCAPSEQQSLLTTSTASNRENERHQRRHLLNVSLSKLHSANQPLRRHLLVFNTIKQLQKDLDVLENEDLYVSLLDDQMEVDQWHSTPKEEYEVEKEEEEEAMESVPADDDRVVPWTWMDESQHIQEGKTNRMVRWSGWGVSSCQSSAGWSDWALRSFNSAGGPASSSEALDDELISWQKDLLNWEDGSIPLCQSGPLSARDLLHLLPIQA